VLHAERIEREIGLLSATLLPEEGSIFGTVRITSVPIVVNRLLIPTAHLLTERHPALRLELIGDARDLSLTRREADLALRLGRPKTGGTRVVARRVGTIRYEVYASASYSALEASGLPWVTYDENMMHLPQAGWIATKVSRDREKIASVCVNDAEGIVEAVAAGLGRSLLPVVVADRDPRLKRLDCRSRSPTISRELWLLMHAELRGLPRIEAVVAWIEESAPR
jgi:DNA-binding transcriptional LysR family regulator